LTKHYYYDYFQGNKKRPNLDCLQKKSYEYIENYFSVHRIGFIDIIKNFRSYNTVNYFNNEEIDKDCTEFFNYSQFIWQHRMVIAYFMLHQFQFMEMKVYHGTLNYVQLLLLTITKNFSNKFSNRTVIKQHSLC
jgi:hypothetical protein